MRSNTSVWSGIFLAFAGLISPVIVNACEENPGQLTISVSGAQAGSTQNYYVVPIPEQGTTSVTIKGDGQTPCPTDQEKCKCNTDTSDPEEDGALKYTFTKDIGTQDPGNGQNIKFNVTQSTTPKEYKFKLTKIEQKYKACQQGWTGGVPSKSNTNASEEVTVLAVKVDLKFAKTSECDGKELDVDLLVNPISVKSSLANGNFTCQKPGGGTSFDNPWASGSQMQSKGGSDYTKWKIANVMWYSTQADHKNDTSPYEVVGTVEVKGVSVNVKKGTFTANGNANCVNGKAVYAGKQIDGEVAYSTVKQANGTYHTTVTIGTLTRNVDSTAINYADAKSQFHKMVQDEEDAHVNQMENPNHPICGPMYNIQTVLSDVQAGHPYDGSSADFSLTRAKSAFIRARNKEQTRSDALYNYPSPSRCAMEKEAKAIAGSSHRLTYAAAYPACPP